MAASVRAAATVGKRFLRPARPRRVEVFLFDNFEMLDVFGPLQLFKSANGAAEKLTGQPPPGPGPPSELAYRIRTVGFRDWAASSGGPAVRTDALVAAEEDAEDAEGRALTTLLIPGGLGTRTLVDDPGAIAWIARRGREVGRVATVCTGAALAGRAGLLDASEATTNKIAFDWVVAASQSDSITWRRRARWVQPRIGSSPQPTQGSLAAHPADYSQMSSDGLGGKHLHIEARRRRFDPESKYGGRGGATLVKAMPTSWVSNEGFKDIVLKSSRPTDEEGNVLVSKLDQEFPELLGSKPASGGHLFRLPELLEAECTSKSTQRDRQLHDIIITTYTLEGVSWMAPNEHERRMLEKRREARLSLAKLVSGGGNDVYKLQVCCKLRDAPLEKIKERTLLDHNARLTAPSSASKARSERARVLEDDWSSCCIPQSPEHYLQVDLGSNCRVTWISTQGRFPRTQYLDKETGMRVVDDTQDWVTYYELSYRVNSGQEWIVLCERLKGNSDPTTEAAHALSHIQTSGEPLCCRYLRFRPLEYHGQPAIRVGVYGERLDGAWQGEVTSTGNQIQYTICRMKEGTNRRQAPGSCGCWRLGCSKCGRYGLCSAGKPRWSATRKRLKEGLLEEVRNLTPAADDDGLPTLREAKPGESAAPVEDVAALSPEEGSEQAASCGGSSDRPGGLARTRSFSEPDLASVASSSLGESVVMVEALEAFVAFDEDEWLMVPE